MSIATIPNDESNVASRKQECLVTSLNIVVPKPQKATASGKHPETSDMRRDIIEYDLLLIAPV